MKILLAMILVAGISSQSFGAEDSRKVISFLNKTEENKVVGGFVAKKLRINNSITFKVRLFNCLPIEANQINNGNLLVRYFDDNMYNVKKIYSLDKKRNYVSLLGWNTWNIPMNAKACEFTGRNGANTPTCDCTVTVKPSELDQVYTDANAIRDSLSNPVRG